MKKLICMVLTLAMILCIPFSAFAAEVPGKNQKSDMMSFTLMDKNGKDRVVEVGPDETVAIPFYQHPSSNNEKGLKAADVVQTATLRIGRSGSDVFFEFVPELQYLLLTVGFTGSFSVINFSGMSEGTYYYTNPVLSDYEPGDINCRVSVVGTYSVLGFEDAPIHQARAFL